MPASPNVLIVDSNRENLASCESLVGKINVNLIMAHSGPEALEKSRGVELALAIINVLLPGMNGCELAKEINKGRKDLIVPVIFVTTGGPDEMEFISKYDDSTADQIHEPFNKQVMVGRIKIFLELFIRKQ
jgi:DNA-binding response OmpR family regulator